MAFVKKTWKDRIAEFPTRRRLTKEDNTSELVTVAREEGTLSQEGDAFSAENMNDLENRIDAEFTELTGKLNYKHMSIKDGTAGITIPGDWIEAYVDITFSLNPQYYFTFHLIRDNLLSTNKKYLQDYYSSENDRHNICLAASATGVKLEKYTYSGQDIGRNCEMNLFYR